MILIASCFFGCVSSSQKEDPYSSYPSSSSAAAAPAVSAGAAASAVAARKPAVTASATPLPAPVLSEREKMAAALFSGVSAAAPLTTPTLSTATRAVVGSGVAPAGIPAPAAARGVPNVGVAAPVVAAAPAPAPKRQDADDILDLAFASAVPAKPAAAAVAPAALAPAAASKQMDDFDSLFGSPSASSFPKPAAVAAAPAPAAADPLDFFGGGGAVAAAPAAVNALASAPAGVAQRLATYGAKSDEVPLGADAHVRISLIRARHDQRTSFLLLLTRTGAGARINSAALHLPVPAQLLAQAEVMPPALTPPPAGAPAGMLSLPTLDQASGAVAVWFNFVCGQGKCL